MSYVILGISIVVGVVIEDLVDGPAANHPWTWAILIGIVALVVLGGAWLVDARLVLTVALVPLGAATWGLFSGWDDRDNYLTPYCAYSAKTQDQVDSCLANTSVEEVDETNSRAGRYARGEVQCGRDAGPLCGK